MSTHRADKSEEQMTSSPRSPRHGRASSCSRASTPAQPTYDVALELGASDTLTSPLLASFAFPLKRLF